jgi:hypothetical protein
MFQVEARIRCRSWNSGLCIDAVPQCRSQLRRQFRLLQPDSDREPGVQDCRRCRRPARRAAASGRGRRGGRALDRRVPWLNRTRSRMPFRLLYVSSASRFVT